MDKSTFSEDEIRRLFRQASSKHPDEQSTAPKQQLAITPPKPSPLHTVPSSPSASPHAPQPISVPSHAYIPAKTRYHSRPQRLFRAFGVFGLSFIFSFGLLNGGTYGSRFNFWWRTDIQGQEAASPAEIERIAGGNSLASDVIPPAQPSSVIPGQTNVPRRPATPITLPRNRLIIPKIRVDAPIVWNADPGYILSDLQKGVAHYRGTALPNSQAGNVFITGHSSGFLWDRSPYTTVFATLDKLVAGDLIAITTENEEYIYRVNGSVVVRSSETSVLGQTNAPTLSLMTCVPVGTNLRRLIVRADLLQIIPLTEANR